MSTTCELAMAPKMNGTKSHNHENFSIIKSYFAKPWAIQSSDYIHANLFLVSNQFAIKYVAQICALSVHWLVGQFATLYFLYFFPCLQTCFFLVAVYSALLDLI